MVKIMRRAVLIPEHDEAHMESRIARLESDMAHFRNEATAMRAEIHDLRRKIDARPASAQAPRTPLSITLERIGARRPVSALELRLWRISALVGILMLIACDLSWN
jgi:hypothetical protein